MTASGSFTLVPYQTNGIKALRVPKKTDAGGVVTEWYYLEYRQRAGNDSTINTAATNGGLIHFGTYDLGARSYLIDGTPTTTSFTDATLTSGKTFEDTVAGVKIVINSVTPSNLSGTLTLTGVCTRANPTATLSPSSQWGEPGEKLIYTGTVRNNDGGACGASTFNLSGNVPNGWQFSLSNSTVNLAPGAQTNVTVEVTSSLSAAPNIYAVIFRAENSAATSFFATNSATYTVNQTKEGDINADGQVNIFDLSTMLSVWNTGDTNADLNDDGVVSIFDLSVLLSNWGI
jgi:hypothetical protein